MVTGGVETVVGVSQDPLFGPVVMAGLGGIFVEVLEDVTFRVPPFDRDEAERMLRELAGFKMLEGVRGAKPADVDALVDVIMKVSRLALDLSDDIARARHQPAGGPPSRCGRPRCIGGAQQVTDTPDQRRRRARWPRWRTAC